MPYNRLLIPGYLSGIRPRPGAREPTASDLSLFAGGGAPRQAPTAPAFAGMRKPPPIGPRLLPGAIQQNPLHAVLPCKPEPGGVRIFHSKTSMTGGMYPQTGIGRHQPKGLATQTDKPTNLPLMPLANTFYAGLNNTLPQPK